MEVFDKGTKLFLFGGSTARGKRACDYYVFDIGLLPFLTSHFTRHTGATIWWGGCRGAYCAPYIATSTWYRCDSIGRSYSRKGHAVVNIRERLYILGGIPHFEILEFKAGKQQTNHTPQTTKNNKPQTTNHKSQITNHKQQTTNHQTYQTFPSHFFLLFFGFFFDMLSRLVSKDLSQD